MILDKIDHYLQILILVFKTNDREVKRYRPLFTFLINIIFDNKINFSNLDERFKFYLI